VQVERLRQLLQLLVGRVLEVQPEEPTPFDVLDDCLALEANEERDRLAASVRGSLGHGPTLPAATPSR
jgi:hypothetical protein